MMSPEILIMWCRNMVGVAMTIETSKMRCSVSRKSEEDLICGVSLGIILLCGNLYLFRYLSLPSSTIKTLYIKYIKIYFVENKVKINITL